MSEDDNEQKLWQGREVIIIYDKEVVSEVASLFNWPENPPTMTVVDEDGNEVDLTRS